MTKKYKAYTPRSFRKGGGGGFIAPIISVVSSVLGGPAGGVIGNVVGSLFADEPEAPSYSAPPAPTQPVGTSEAVEVPKAVESAAVSEAEPAIVSAEAQARADRRRAATQQVANDLISLTSTSPSTKVKSLLGE